MESWKRKLRMGMVGGGEGAFIGGVHRVAATLDQQIELVAGCFSRDVENTKRTGEQLYLDKNRCYSTYEEMAAAEAALPEEKRIDFVTIVTPNHLHFSIARTFLESGFHVVCDKPMTYDEDEAKQLVGLVDQTGLSGSEGALLWKQENPNSLELFRYGEPRQTLTRGQGYLSGPAADCTRIPSGHPEGYLEAFATIYCGVVEAVRRHIDGNPLSTDEYNFPTVYDGLRGMQFIHKAVESAKQGGVWVSM